MPSLVRKKCLYCKEKFKSKSDRSRFCSSKHKVAYYRKIQKNVSVARKKNAPAIIESIPIKKKIITKKLSFLAPALELLEKSKKEPILHLTGIQIQYLTWKKGYIVEPAYKELFNKMHKCSDLEFENYQYVQPSLYKIVLADRNNTEEWQTYLKLHN